MKGVPCCLAAQSPLLPELRGLLLPGGLTAVESCRRLPSLVHAVRVVLDRRLRSLDLTGLPDGILLLPLGNALGIRQLGPALCRLFPHLAGVLDLPGGVLVPEGLDLLVTGHGKFGSVDHLLIPSVLLRGGLNDLDPLPCGAAVVPLLGGSVDTPGGVLVLEILLVESGFRLLAFLRTQGTGLRSLHGPLQLGFRQVAVTVLLLVPLDKILRKFRGEGETAVFGVLGIEFMLPVLDKSLTSCYLRRRETTDGTLIGSLGNSAQVGPIYIAIRDLFYCCHAVEGHPFRRKTDIKNALIKAFTDCKIGLVVIKPICRKGVALRVSLVADVLGNLQQLVQVCAGPHFRLVDITALSNPIIGVLICAVAPLTRAPVFPVLTLYHSGSSVPGEGKRLAGEKTQNHLLRLLGGGYVVQAVKLFLPTVHHYVLLPVRRCFDGVPFPGLPDLLDLALLVCFPLVVIRELRELADVFLGVGGIGAILLCHRCHRVAVVDEEDHIRLAVMPAFPRLRRVKVHPGNGKEAQLAILLAEIVRGVSGVAIQLRAAVLQGRQQEVLDNATPARHISVVKDCRDIAVALHRHTVAAVLTHETLHLGECLRGVGVHHLPVRIGLDRSVQGSCEQVRLGGGLQFDRRNSQICSSVAPSLRRFSTSIRSNRSALYRSSSSSSVPSISDSFHLISFGFGNTIFAYLLGEISSFIMGALVQPVNIPSFFAEGEFRQIVVGRILVLVRALPPSPLLAGPGLVLLVDIGLHVGVDRLVGPPVVLVPLLIVGMTQHRLSCPTQPRHLLKGLVPELPILGVRGVLDNLNTGRRRQYPAIFGDRIPGGGVLLPLPLCRLQRLLQALAQGLQSGLGLGQGADVLPLLEAREETVDLRLRLLQDRGGPARQTVQGPLVLEGRPHQVRRQLLVHVGVEVLLRLLLLPDGAVELRQGLPVSVDAAMGVLEVAALFQGAEGGEDVRRQGAVRGRRRMGQLMAQGPVHGPGGVHLVPVEGQHTVLDAGVGLGKEALGAVDHLDLFDPVALGEDRLDSLPGALQLPASRGFPGLLDQLFLTLAFPVLFLLEGELFFARLAGPVLRSERVKNGAVLLRALAALLTGLPDLLVKVVRLRVRHSLIARGLTNAGQELIPAHPGDTLYPSVHGAPVLQILLICQANVRGAGLRESGPVSSGELGIARQGLPITADLAHSLRHHLAGPVLGPFRIGDGLAAQGETGLLCRDLLGGSLRHRCLDGGFRLDRLGCLRLLELGRHLGRLLLPDLGGAPVDGIELFVGDLPLRELDPRELREECLGLGVGGIDLVDLLHVQLLPVHQALDDIRPELGRLPADALGLHDPCRRGADHRGVRIHLLNGLDLLPLRDSTLLGDLHLRLQGRQGIGPDSAGLRPITGGQDQELRDVLIVRLRRPVHQLPGLLLIGLEEAAQLRVGDLLAFRPLALQLLRLLGGFPAQDPASLKSGVLGGLDPVGDVGAKGFAPPDFDAMVHGLVHGEGSAAQHDGDPAALVTGLLDALLLLLREPAGQEVPVDIPGALRQSLLPAAGGAVQHPVLVRHGDGLLGLLLQALTEDVEPVLDAGEAQELHNSLHAFPFAQLPGQSLGPALRHRVQQFAAAQGQDVDGRVPHLDQGGDQGLVVGGVPCLLLRESQVKERLEGRAPHGVVAVFAAGGYHAGLDALGEARGVADTGDSRADSETSGAAQKAALDLRLGLIEELGQVVGEALTEPRGDLPLLIQDAAVLIHVFSQQFPDGFGIRPVLRRGVVQVVVPGQALILGQAAHVEVGGELPREAVLLLSQGGLLQDVELPVQTRLLCHGLLVALDRLLVGGRLGSAHGPGAHAARRLNDLVTRLLDLLLGRLLPLPGFLLHGGLVCLQRLIHDACPQAGEPAGDPGGAVQLALGLLLRGVGTVFPLGAGDQLRPGLRLLMVRPSVRFAGKRHWIRGALLLGCPRLYDGDLLRLCLGRGLLKFNRRGRRLVLLLLFLIPGPGFPGGYLRDRNCHTASYPSTEGHLETVELELPLQLLLLRGGKAGLVHHPRQVRDIAVPPSLPGEDTLILIIIQGSGIPAERTTRRAADRTNGGRRTLAAAGTTRRTGVRVELTIIQHPDIILRDPLGVRALVPLLQEVVVRLTLVLNAGVEHCLVDIPAASGSGRPTRGTAGRLAALATLCRRLELRRRNVALGLLVRETHGRQLVGGGHDAHF